MLVWVLQIRTPERLTVEMMVVTRLPHLEKIAKKPTTNSAAVKIVAMMNA